MLPQSSGIETDPALADVVGFLEACRIRMIELIEAGTMGLLDEDILELCLKTNDVLNRTLDAEMVFYIIYYIILFIFWRFTYIYIYI